MFVYAQLDANLQVSEETVDRVSRFAKKTQPVHTYMKAINSSQSVGILEGRLSTGVLLIEDFVSTECLSNWNMHQRY